MDIINSDTNTVMAEIGVLLGTQDVCRVTGSLEVFGIYKYVTLLRPRWIEFCYTREESILCQNKITVNFEATQYPGGVNMTDSIQVWTKTKGAFGSPEDSEEYSAANPAASNHEAKEASVQPLSLIPVDNVVATTLETHAALVVCDTCQVTDTNSCTALELDEVTRLPVYGTTEASPVGVMARLRTALTLLNTEIKGNEGSDQLVSQEGAFENVKVNFSGEQGQTIKQLLNAHMMKRRDITCCVSSPGVRRQLRAVANKTQLSVVTAASLVPIRKITLHTVFRDMYLLLMSSAGHIYFQPLCDKSSAHHGSFSETNIIGTTHRDVSGTIGVLSEIYYKSAKADADAELGEHQTESNRSRQWLMFFQASSWSI